MIAGMYARTHARTHVYMSCMFIYIHTYETVKKGITTSGEHSSSYLLSQPANKVLASNNILLLQAERNETKLRDGSLQSYLQRTEKKKSKTEKKGSRYVSRQTLHITGKQEKQFRKCACCEYNSAFCSSRK